MERIFLSPPHLGENERQLLLDAFDSNWVAPLGPHVDGFEREMAAYIGVKHAAALSCGTAAIHLALLNLKVEPSDEVFTSSLTFAATANAITYVGATPVFIDSEEKSWNMDPTLLAEALKNRASKSKLPKAVIPVDLYGQTPDMEAIQAICREYEVPVIEDAAEALGAAHRGKKAGSFGDMSILSFNGNKIITTSGGGMLLSNNEAWIKHARFLATQARDPAPHYQHSHIGYNYRLSNLLAAVGRGQLQVLDERVKARRQINHFYRQAFKDLPGVKFMPEAKHSHASFWLSCMLIDPKQASTNTDQIREHLGSLNIEARPVWKPMHLQPIFKDAPMFGGAVSERLFEHGLCLPSGSALSESQLNLIAKEVRACFVRHDRCP